MTLSQIIDLTHPARLRRADENTVRQALTVAMELSDARTIEALSRRMGEIMAHKEKRKRHARRRELASTFRKLATAQGELK